MQRMCVAYFGPGCVFLDQRANSKYNTPMSQEYEQILALSIESEKWATIGLFFQTI